MLLTRIFWTIVLVEIAGLAVLFFQGLRAPSESGGREMGLIFGVMLPFIVVLSAALLYWRATSSAIRIAATVVAAAPLLFLAYQWTRNFVIDREVANSDVTAFQDPAQRTLAAAILNGNVARVNELAPHTNLSTPGLNHLTGSDKTILNLALSRNSPATLDIVTALLRAGANPNQTAENGWTIPLVRAIMLKQSGLVKMLLDAGADPNRKDPNGAIVYHVALSQTNDARLSILTLMLDHGAHPDAVDGAGKTALMVAAIHGNWLAIDLLVSRRADPRSKDAAGKTAYDYALARIREEGAQPDPGLIAAADKLK